MPRRSAEARTSAAWAASSSGTPKWRNVRLLNWRNASMGKSLVSTSGMFSPLPVTLRRQGLPAGFNAKRNEQKTNGEGDGRHRDGDSQRLKMLNAGSDQKGDSRSAKSRNGRGKGESARAAFRRILLRQPQGVNGKIRAAKTKKEKANKKPGKRGRPEIENLSKRERDEGQHQREKKSQCSAPAEFFREPRHRQAAQNRRKRNQHGRSRSELRRGWSHPPRRFRKHRHCSRNVDRSCPEAANGSQHEQGIQNRSAAHRARKKCRERFPDLPGANHSFFLAPSLRLGYAVTNPRQQKRRQSANEKHRAPSIAAADPVVQQRGKKNPNVITGVHVAGAGTPPVFRPLLGDEGATHGPLATDADSCQQAQHRELPDIRHQRAEKGEHRVPDDGEHERSNATELVADGSPEKRESPSAEKQGKEQSAVIADVAFRCGNAGTREQFAQGRHQDQGINEGVHAVKSPASPRSPKSPDLISREWCRLGGYCFRMGIGSGHVARTISKVVAGKRKI